MFIYLYSFNVNLFIFIFLCVLAYGAELVGLEYRLRRNKNTVIGK